MYDSKKVERLANEIYTNKRLYYAGKPKISDFEFDKLEDELRSFAPNHPVLSFVGSDQGKNGTKVSHQKSMLSLQKTYDFDELVKWTDKHESVGMWKVDGNSLSLVFDQGKLKVAKTRGDGKMGEDVTEKAVWVSDIRRSFEEDYSFEIRGELYCSESKFGDLAEYMESKGLDRPTSPRNIVAGLLGRKSHVSLARYFNFLAFDVISEDERLMFKTEIEKFSWLEEQGFSIPKPQLIDNENKLRSYVDEVRQYMDEGDVGLDGVVFSYNSTALHQELGQTAHHPRYKISFKWQGETAISKISNIIWATSRLGIVTPVAQVAPVELSGATITNITLHNAEHVRAYNLKVGDEIRLVRSGEVIPKFLEVVNPSEGHYHWPQHCESCISVLSFDGVRLKCSNKQECPAQQKGSILNWIKCAGIDSLSEKRLDSMMDLGLVSSPADLYKLSVNDFLKLPLTKEKMAQKLFGNIQNSKSITLVQFLSGLGIEGMGGTMWERLLAHNPSLAQVRGLSVDHVIKIDGFAETSASNMVLGLDAKSNMIDDLLAQGVNPQDFTVVDTSDGGVSGMTFVITGSLSKPRSEIAKAIKNAGGKVSSSVSKNTFAVVTNDTDSTSSKMKKAKELGVEIWNEEKLFNTLGE